MRLALATVTAALIGLALAAPAGADKLQLRRVGKFKAPTYVAMPAKGRSQLFVVERRGVIRVVRHGKKLKRPFLDIKSTTMDARPDQRGLFSMAFAPDYSKSRRFYVMYVHTGDIVEVDEFRRSKSNPARALKSSRRPLIQIPHAGMYHHGGQLQFGRDKMLWISTGIGDKRPSAQDMGDLHGKMLRIDPHPSGGLPYTVPPDNPFAFTQGVRPEIWASGLRNPWRFSFDRKTGAMAIGDVGETSYEEVDYRGPKAAAGVNFGYPIFEGFHRMLAEPTPPRYVPPVLEHAHAPRYCAVMGGYVVRDRRLKGLYGRYLYTDNCNAWLRSLVFRKGKARDDRRALRIGGVVSFGEDNRGHIYLATNFDRVYAIDPKPKPKRKKR